MKSIIVFYHAECPDGFSAAWAAFKYFGKKAEYVPLFHQTPIPDVKGKEVYFVDITPVMPVLKRILKEAKQIVALDHHVSREKEIKSVPKHRYGTNHSAAFLSWSYFFPKRPVPFFLRYVEDNDLWRFKLPHAKEITLHIAMIPMDFKSWSQAVHNLENSRKYEAAVEEGRLLIKYRDKRIQDILAHAQAVSAFGYKTLAVNSPIFRSEIGNLIAEKMKKKIGIAWSVNNDGRIYISLRSDGKVNVAKIAEKYKGGGHKAAAGFYLPKGAKFPWKVIVRK